MSEGAFEAVLDQEVEVAIEGHLEMGHLYLRIVSQSDLTAA